MKPDKVGVLDGGKAPGYDGAVLAGHLHHVGHGADGGQRAVAGEQGLLPVRAAQRQRQLQRHAAARQMLEGIAAVGPVGVYHRHGAGQRLLALVVVGDDHVHAQRVGEVYLLHAGDAAVHGDQQAGSLAVQALDGVDAQAVAVLDAARDIVQHIGAPALEIVHQNTGGGDTVHVVVAEHGDPLVVGQRPLHPLHSLVHVGHEEWAVGQARLMLQKGGGLLRRGDAPGGQHRRHKTGITRRRQTGRRLGVRLGNAPFLKFHGGPPPSCRRQKLCRQFHRCKNTLL